jgi:hypothetical protein
MNGRAWLRSGDPAHAVHCLLSLRLKERPMLKYALLALPFAVLATATPHITSAEPVRTGTTLKRACLTKPQIIAQLKRRGFSPVEKLQRRGDTYSVLARRGGRASRTGALVVVDACTGQIQQVNKALLPAADKLKLKTICKSKAEIVTQFDQAGYYHIQVFGPMNLNNPPQGYTGKVYTVRAWTKTPPKCPWDFVVKCSDGAILQQTPDFC